jgi:glutamate dehydrogenase (NADP+)
VYLKEGLSVEHVGFVHDLKEKRRGRIAELADKFKGVEFHADRRPWQVPCDVAMPCATQNELAIEDAHGLVKNGVKAVCEGANMPTSIDAAELFRERQILFAPGKAANAGGVAVSGLEQSQNAMRISWSHNEVDERLQRIMSSIHARCVQFGEHNGRVDYVDGANIAGFQKVAEALLAYGVV